MKILLIEDESFKVDAITKKIQQLLPDGSCSIIKARTLTESIQYLSSDLFDLIIFDVYLPISNPDDVAENISHQLITAFSKSKNYQAESIALTKYDLLDNLEDIRAFNESGVTIVQYNDESKWSVCLELKINKIKNKIKYDFLIFCALSKERAAYSKTDAQLGDLRVINGMDCQDIEIGNMKGLCIKPTQMGLVHMAIVASKAIELFQPKIVAMSGICAGNSEEVNLLDIVIADTCWEYQTGKFKNNGFQQEPYQVTMNNELRTRLSHFASDPNVLTLLKSDLYDTPLKNSRIVIKPISSGSSVVASNKKMKEIGCQHRKLAAIEMEMYSLYEAAYQSICSPLFFGAKAVVDFGDGNKNDNYQLTGCIISARLIVQYLYRHNFKE